MTYENFPVELFKFFAYFKKEEVPDITEEQFHAIKKRSLDSLTNFDCLNGDDVDAIRQFREKIFEEKMRLEFQERIQ